MDDIKRAELLTACLVLKEYLSPFVCDCDECDDCYFCAGDIIHTLEELEEVIKRDR